MCTISIVPAKDKLIFTFSRDEQTGRKTPEYLMQVDLGFKKIYYARDTRAGGTWFSADDKGNVALLFNGGFTKHEKTGVYARSRGLVLLELISAVSMLDNFNAMALDNIEPFSLILFSAGELFRAVWNGHSKQILPLNPGQHHIFSSATLYTDEVQLQRKAWLEDFLAGLPHITDQDMYAFHNAYNPSDKENGLVIDRNGSLRTLSISQAIVNEKETFIKHWDVIEQLYYEDKIPRH